MGNKFSRKGKKGAKSPEDAAGAAAEQKDDGPKQYVVSIVASQGRKLLAKDVGGTSDPFLTLEVADPVTKGHPQIAKSSTVFATLNPVWNERIEVVLDNKPTKFAVKCYDWDRFSSNDFIGSVEVDIQDAWWKGDDEVKYQWFELKQKNGKPAGEVELQINCREVDAADANDDHSDAYFHSITHFLKVTIKEANDLKSADLLTPNDNICRVSFGSQSFTTKTVHGANPVWNQSAWILVCQPRQKNFKVVVEIFDHDVVSAPDNIGARYFDIAPLFQSDEIVEYNFQPLNTFKATKDNQLSHGTATSDLNKNGEPAGTISVSFQMITKSKAQKSLFHEILKLVSGDEEKESSAVTKDHFDTAMMLIDPHLTSETLDDLFKILDKNSDGEIDQLEATKILNSARFNFNGLARKLLALSSDPGADQSQLLAHIMDPEIKKKEGNVVIVKERDSGLEVEENIPPYIKVAMKIMFANVIGRKFAGRTVPLLEKMSKLQGVKYSKPESVSEIPGFIKLHNLNESEFDKDIKEYENFNDFFARGLKDEAVQRPMPAGNNIAVSPADSRMMVFPEWIDATNLWVKGDKFTVDNLLGPAASQYGEWFKGGSFVIARLAPQDYHRWHTPVAGRFGPRFDIPGALYTVNPIAINQPVNVYTENKRCVCLIDTEEFGAVILIAVAATMVGSMQIFGDLDAPCVKGAVHGKFFFGGSTILLLFQPGTIKFSDDLLLNSTSNPKRPIETLVKVRSKLGDATGKPGNRL
eukprot:TRINITY_DN23362_c0_g1_i1.p1 TRINITY_DN23362_c0_g1~~TRINITY_DN23362_c0_g1_i1.p1  ORF type:complete len:754 (-),score=236.71 TRINITY_DN23362_c0_g1_i1:41-2302(-)